MGERDSRQSVRRRTPRWTLLPGHRRTAHPGESPAIPPWPSVGRTHRSHPTFPRHSQNSPLSYPTGDPALDTAAKSVLFHRVEDTLRTGSRPRYGRALMCRFYRRAMPSVLEFLRQTVVGWQDAKHAAGGCSPGAIYSGLIGWLLVFSTALRVSASRTRRATPAPTAYRSRALPCLHR